MEIIHARKQWRNLFKVLKEKKIQPTILHPIKIFFKIEIYRSWENSSQQTYSTRNVKGKSFRKKKNDIRWQSGSTKGRKINRMVIIWINTKISLSFLKDNGLFNAKLIAMYCGVYNLWRTNICGNNSIKIGKGKVKLPQFENSHAYVHRKPSRIYKRTTGN